MATLHFHFDFISPYAWLAWTQIHALAARHQATVRPRPVLFAALLHHHGHKGPAEIPPKRLWVFKDVVRRAARLGVPLQPPPAHPFNPLPALRAVLSAPPPRRRELIDALFAATWGDGQPRGIDTVAAVVAIAAGLGIEVDPAGPAAKAGLRAETEAAIAAGVFGVPTVRIVHDDSQAESAAAELFWGLDSFDLLQDHLEGRDPVDAELLARWRDLPVGARR